MSYFPCRTLFLIITPTYKSLNFNSSFHKVVTSTIFIQKTCIFYSLCTVPVPMLYRICYGDVPYISRIYPIYVPYISHTLKIWIIYGLNAYYLWNIF
jgi:hypothetical protein